MINTVLIGDNKIMNKEGQDIVVTTICYLEKDNKYLMLHRTKKKSDLSKGKWIGVGGHFKDGESPDECIRREVLEETGYIIDKLEFRGIITFISPRSSEEIMFLYTSDSFYGNEIECDEGTLKWINKNEIENLSLWEGDRIFLKKLDEDESFFSMKLVYDENDNLISVG